MKTRFSIRQIAIAALVGALYVVLGYFGNIFGLTFGPVQCRFAEALTVLPYLCPLSAWGLFTGCIVTNILSPYGPLDLIFGSLATLLAGFLTSRCKNKWLAPLPPVLCNALISGALIAFETAGTSGAFWGALAYNALTVGGGELIACYALGLPLTALLEKTLFKQTAADGQGRTFSL